MNTDLSSMSVRCPDAVSLGKVKLKNHKLVFKQFCDVEKEHNSLMECALWSITDACEDSLGLSLWCNLSCSLLKQLF